MFKICPRCRDEFVPQVVECPDCRVPLRSAEELANAPAETASASASPEIALSSAVVLRRGSPSDLRELCALLTDRGVRFVVDTHPLGRKLAAPGRGAASDVTLAIYVEEADAEQASRVEREWVFATVPDAVDAPLASADACPGCGEPLAAAAAACGSCGLEFPPLEVACPRCGQAVAVEAEHCAHCGYRP